MLHYKRKNLNTNNNQSIYEATGSAEQPQKIYLWRDKFSSEYFSQYGSLHITHKFQTGHYQRTRTAHLNETEGIWSKKHTFGLKRNEDKIFIISFYFSLSPAWDSSSPQRWFLKLVRKRRLETTLGRRRQCKFKVWDAPITIPKKKFGIVCFMAEKFGILKTYGWTERAPYERQHTCSLSYCIYIFRVLHTMISDGVVCFVKSLLSFFSTLESRFLNVCKRCSWRSMSNFSAEQCWMVL